MRREHLETAAAFAGIAIVLGSSPWSGRRGGTADFRARTTSCRTGTPTTAAGRCRRAHEGHEGHGGISIASLRGPGGVPDDHFRLTARTATIRLASGRTVEALTFDGKAPGPELRVRQGDLVEVDLAQRGRRGRRHDPLARGRRAERGGRRRRRDAERCPTRRALHVPLPGEPGRDVLVPQPPGLVEGGAARTLRRVRHRAEERAAQPRRLDARHTHVRRRCRPSTRTTTSPRAPCLPARPSVYGSSNTDSVAQRVALDGTPFRVAAIDGTDLHGPTEIADRDSSSRRAVASTSSFTMPASPVQSVARRDERACRPELRRDGDSADPEAPRAGLRPAHLRQSCPHSLRPNDALRPPLPPHDHAQGSASSTAGPAGSGRSTAGSTPTSRCSSSRRTTSSR